MTNRCPLLNIRHSQRTFFAPQTNVPNEKQNKIFGIHRRVSLHDAPESRSFFEYARKTQPLSHLHISGIRLNFQLNISRNKYRECTAHNCSDLVPDFQKQLPDFSALFQNMMFKTISVWLRAI